MTTTRTTTLSERDHAALWLLEQEDDERYERELGWTAWLESTFDPDLGIDTTKPEGETVPCLSAVDTTYSRRHSLPRSWG